MHKKLVEPDVVFSPNTFIFNVDANKMAFDNERSRSSLFFVLSFEKYFVVDEKKKVDGLRSPLVFAGVFCWVTTASEVFVFQVQLEGMKVNSEVTKQLLKFVRK